MRLNLIYIILPLFLIACSDNSPMDDPIVEELSIIELMEGNYNGLYESKECALIPEIYVDDPFASLEIIARGKDAYSGTLNYISIGTKESFNFTGGILSDSILIIDEFEGEYFTYEGKIFLRENGKLRLILSNGCTFGDDAFPTEFFNED